MSKDRQVERTLALKKLMQQVGIKSFRQLYRSTGTSERTIGNMRSGNLDPIRWQTLVKIAKTLQIPITELIDRFGDVSTPTARQQLDTLDREYQLLRHQFQQQRTALQAEFQDRSLQTLESFLTYFPTAKAAAADNPDFPASKIFPLVQSIDRLIAQWGVTTIGEVGAEVGYDPRWHQLIAGSATIDELVTVRYVGYRQGEKLIFRAKVSN